LWTLDCGALGCNLARRSGDHASLVSLDCERYEQKIESNEYRHVTLAANAEAVAMQTFAQQKIHAIPCH
jgi:hypothetical protein